MGAATGELRPEAGKSGLAAAKPAAEAQIPRKNRSPDPRTDLVEWFGLRISTNC